MIEDKLKEAAIEVHRKLLGYPQFGLSQQSVVYEGLRSAVESERKACVALLLDMTVHWHPEERIAIKEIADAIEALGNE